MHEVSVCQSLLRQLTAVAEQQNAQRIDAVRLRIGPLSGVDPDLVRHAFPFVCAQTIAANARLEIETAPVRVHCAACGSECEAELQYLACRFCGAWQTRLISGDELLLASVTLSQREVIERI
jgi:hydrogenase nickel incorporation protein HypA/HybF